MSEPKQLTLTLHANAVVAPALRAIQTTVETVSFCLNAVETGDTSTAPEFEPSRFHMKFDGPQLTAEQRKTMYHNWILSKGFQELARGIRATLERAYLYNSMCHTAKELGSSQQWGDVQQRVRKFQKEAHDANFPTLLRWVNKGLTAPLHFENEFSSLQKVRNCLEHRGGVVAKKDVGEDDVLRLTFPRGKLTIEQDGKEIEVGKGAFIEKDTVIKFSIVIDERVYKLGEAIVFKAEEFHDIGFGCWRITGDLGSKLPKIKVEPAAEVRSG